MQNESFFSLNGSIHDLYPPLLKFNDLNGVPTGVASSNTKIPFSLARFLNLIHVLNKSIPWLATPRVLSPAQNDKAPLGITVPGLATTTFVLPRLVLRRRFVTLQSRFLLVSLSPYGRNSRSTQLSTYPTAAHLQMLPKVETSNPASINPLTISCCSGVRIYCPSSSKWNLISWNFNIIARTSDSRTKTLSHISFFSYSRRRSGFAVPFYNNNVRR